MPRKSVPRYCHHKASGQARVLIDGRHHYLGKHGTVESRRAYAKLIAEWQEAQETPPSELSVGQLTLIYLEHCRSHYRKGGQPTSQVHVVQAALRRVNRLHRDTMAAEFSPRMLKAVRQSMIDDRLARNTINGDVGRIRRMFRWAVSEELVPVNTLVSLETIRDLQQGRSDARETDSVRPVADAAIDAIREHVPPEVWGLIQFQRRTGARPGEAVIIRGCDLNMAGEIWEYTPSRHKLEHKQKSRIIMIGPAGQEILKPFLKTDLQAYLFSSSSNGSTPYRRDSYRNAILRGCELAFGMPAQLRYIGRHVARQKDLSDSQRGELRRTLSAEAKAWRKEHCWHPNQLRHTFATAARRALGIEAARVTLGHSSAVTSEIYAERDLDAARKVLALIG
jgi:integrase